MDAERVLHKLSERARQMFRLRDAGYGWEEVAALFNTSDEAARAEFSRELKRLKSKLANNTTPKPGSTASDGDAFYKPAQ